MNTATPIVVCKRTVMIKRQIDNRGANKALSITPPPTPHTHTTPRTLTHTHLNAQILSDQSKNFSQNTTVNYEDPNFSVDLPVFAIHGNHDDPTRDGGADMLAALDILSATNLLNYYGRHDEVDKVTVSPILLRKVRVCGVVERSDDLARATPLFLRGSLSLPLFLRHENLLLCDSLRSSLAG